MTRKYVRISRGNQERILERISKNTYKLTGETEYFSCDHSTNPTFIDFEGGPYIGVGDNLRNIFNGIKIDKIVEKIKITEEACIITTK